VAVFPHDWRSPSAECDHPPARPGGTRRVPPPLRRSRPTGAHAHRTARASYRPEPPDVVRIVTGHRTWLSDAAAPKLLIAAEPGILIVGRSLEFSLVASRTRPRSRSPAATSSRRIRLTRSGGRLPTGTSGSELRFHGETIRPRGAARVLSHGAGLRPTGCRPLPR
jgi:hypothetical protein